MLIYTIITVIRFAHCVFGAGGFGMTTSFRELMQHLEQSLGSCKVPLNPNAKGLKDLFESIPLHPEVMRHVCQSIFTQNHCKKLDDPIHAAATYAALAPIRLKVLSSARTDIDLFHFVEQLCAKITALLGEEERVGQFHDQAVAGHQVVWPRVFHKK